MKVLAFQLYIGFLLLQGAFMKSIQNAKDHDISIASLKSAAATKKKEGRSKCVELILIILDLYLQHIRKGGQAKIYS
jgi:hypothetical protein